jgi:hypothetical protein
LVGGTPAREALKRARFSSAGLMQSWFIAAAIFLLIVEFVVKSGFNWRSLLLATYRPLFLDKHVGVSLREALFFWSWVLALCIAYSLHTLHMGRHARKMKVFAVRINSILEAAGQEPAYWLSPTILMGVPTLWLMAVFVCLLFSGLWAIPVAVANAYHKEYILQTNTDFRSDLADRVKTIMSSNPSTPQ